jgi:hypothetical protein
MQTFLPHKDFTKSAQALDSKRLNKQILECYQILNVLSNPDPRAGWRNHPAVKMWRGSEWIIVNYALRMIDEANVRGIKTDKNLDNITNLSYDEGQHWGTDYPSWYDNETKMARVTTTHKANLYRKDPIYYMDFVTAVAHKDNEPCCERCNYYWVTHTLENK